MRRKRLMCLLAVWALSLAPMVMAADDSTRPPRDFIAAQSQILASDPANVAALQARGRAYAAMKEYGPAMADLSAVAALSPGSIEAQLELADLCLAGQKPNRAVLEYAKLLDMELSVAQRVYVLNQRAQAYHALNILPRALADLDAVLALEPDNIDAHLRVAQLYVDAGDRDEAMRRAEALIARAADDARGHVLRARLLLDARHFPALHAACTRSIEAGIESSELYAMRSDANERLGRFDEAIADANRALELDPRNKEALKNRGRTYVSLEKFDLGIRDYEAALEIDPNYVFAINNLSLVYTRLGDDDKAMALLDRAISIEPTGTAHNNRGTLHHRRGDFERAMADFTRALQLDPHEPNARMNRGQLFLKLGQAEEALADFNLYIEQFPKRAKGYFERARAWHAIGEMERAFEDFGRALEHDPNHTWARINRGLILHDRAEHAAALTEFREAERIEPDNPRVHGELSRCYYRLERFDEGLAAAKRGIELDRDNLLAWHYGGHCLIGADDYAEALRYIEQAVRLDPNDSHLRELRAFSARESGQFDLALTDYNQLIAESPRHAEWRYGRAQVHVELKKDNEALVDINMAIRVKPEGKYYLLRGELMMRRLNIDQAVADFERCIQRWPTIHNYCMLARAHCAKGELEKTLEAYSQALRLGPNDSAVRSCHALMSAVLGNHADAQEDCQVLFGLRNDQWPLFVRAHCRMMAEDFAGALEDVEATINKEGIGADGWPVMIAWHAAVQLDRPDRAEELIAQWKPIDEVPRQSVRFLRGEITAEEFQASSKSDYQRVYIDCWLGYHHYVKGELAKARDYFQRAADYPHSQHCEYMFARHMLVKVTDQLKAQAPGDE